MVIAPKNNYICNYFKHTVMIFPSMGARLVVPGVAINGCSANSTRGSYKWTADYIYPGNVAPISVGLLSNLFRY